MRRVGRRHRRADDRRREDLDHRDLAGRTGVDRPLRAEGPVVERVEERPPVICVAVDDDVGAVLEAEELIGVFRSERQIAELLGEVLLVVALMAGHGALRLERIHVRRQQADAVHLVRILEPLHDQLSARFGHGHGLGVILLIVRDAAFGLGDGDEGQAEQRQADNDHQRGQQRRAALPEPPGRRSEKNVHASHR